MVILKTIIIDRLVVESRRKMKKYVCLMEGCDFITSDAEEAGTHRDMGEDHTMAEVDDTGGNITCKPMRETGGVEIEEEEESGV